MTLTVQYLEGAVYFSFKRLHNLQLDRESFSHSAHPFYTHFRDYMFQDRIFAHIRTSNSYYYVRILFPRHLFVYFSFSQ